MPICIDQEGYPTEGVFQLIRVLSHDNPLDGFRFIRELWWDQETLWNEEFVHPEDKNQKPFIRYQLSTGGYWVNERIIEALQENKLFWSSTWVYSPKNRRNIFEIQTT